MSNLQHGAGAKIEIEPGVGIAHISCKKIQLFDDKVILDLDENTLPKMKTIVIKIGKNTYTFKQS